MEENQPQFKCYVCSFGCDDLRKYLHHSCALDLSTMPSTSSAGQPATANTSAVVKRCWKKFYCDKCKIGLSTKGRLEEHRKTCKLFLIAPTTTTTNLSISNFTLINSAFQKKYRLYQRPLTNCFTLLDINNLYRDDLENLIKAISAELGPLKIGFSVHVIFEKLVSGDIVESPIHSIFKSYINANDDMDELIKESLAEIQLIIDHYTERGSGFIILKIDSIEVYVAAYQPHHGGCRSIKLPQQLINKKCLLSINCVDNCFMYSILAGIYEEPRNASRTSLYDKYINNHDFSKWRGLVSLDQIKSFEKANAISVSVFSYNLDGKYVIPLRITNMKARHHVKLFLFEDHYFLIRTFSRLLNRDSCYRRHHCERCLNGFRHRSQLEEHLVSCENRSVQRVLMPKKFENGIKNNIVKRDLRKEIQYPIVIYADFECITVPSDDPLKVTTHYPTSYGYCVVDWNNKIIKSEYRHGENVVKDFLLSIKETETWIEQYLELHGKKVCVMFRADEDAFLSAINCWICGKILGEDRVRDHCHLTGAFRAAAHNGCNLAYSLPKRIPIFFHNLKNYDGHLLIRGIDSHVFTTKITIISQSIEKYIGWYAGNFAFLDSYAFLPASIDTLSRELSQRAKETFLRQEWPTQDLTDLCQKAVLPYEYLDSFEKYSEEQLPPIEEFYSSLSDSNITPEMYERLQRIWKQFNCHNLGELIDIYLRLDVLMLCAIFQDFRATSIRDWKIDPPHYMSVPGLSLTAAIKYLKVELELFTCLEMYMMIEDGIRGGFTTTVKRHAKANNPYMADYDGGDQSWLLYLDVNNLYGWAMVSTLPIGDYKWADVDLNTILATDDDAAIGYILEVDLEYPAELHDAHNDFPLAPHKMKIDDSMLSETAQDILSKLNYKPAITEKLVATFLPRKKYVVHYASLKFYVSHGMVVSKVHRIITFSQRKWLKTYISLCTHKRQEARSSFTSSLYKLFVNSKMEN